MSYQWTVDAFAALADPVRRGLLVRLARGPARVVDLAADHDVSRPAVSRHLRVLGEAGLVSAEEHGRERHYRLAPTGLEPVGDYLRALLPTPPVPAHRLDGLDLEMRRTMRDRPRATPTTATPTTATPSTEEDTA